MSPSLTAHIDTFTSENLPPRDQWPDLESVLPLKLVNDPMNAAEILIDRAVSTFGSSQPCLLTPAGEQWSYGDLLERSNQVAQVLVENFGLVPGNRVLLRSPNNPWLVACWLGVLKAGGVVISTMHALRATELSQLITLTHPTLCIVDHRFVTDLEEAVAQKIPVLQYGQNSVGDLPSQCLTKSGIFANIRTASDDVAILAPTSGTTGAPKITMHFHRDILSIAETFGRHVLAPQSNDIFSGTPPVAFTFGLGGLVIFPLYFGASTLLVEHAAPLEMAQLCHKHGVTILLTAPTAYRAIMREGEAHLLSGVRKAVASGEHLPVETWHQFRSATGIELINVLGSTEMLHGFIAAAGSPHRPGSIGQPVPGFRVKVVDQQGKESAPGECGYLAVIGPTGCRYLYGDQQQNYVSDGWNITGDLVRQDTDGYLWYEARADGIIVSSGYNISAPEVESALAAHEDVVEAAVIGVPDPERGRIVRAYVVLRHGAVANAAKRQELQNFVKARISPYKYPREVLFIASLPRNPNGKLQHFRLQSTVAEENNT